MSDKLPQVTLPTDAVVKTYAHLILRGYERIANGLIASLTPDAQSLIISTAKIELFGDQRDSAQQMADEPFDRLDGTG